jgi:fumarate hydratase class II
LNTHPRFAARVREQLAQRASAGVGERIAAPLDSFAAQAARDGLVALSGALKTAAVALTKICNDLRWMASGPRAGLGEIVIAELQKGSSIMPGKVNPVIPEAVLQVCAQVIGNDTTITVSGMQGNFELNVMIPVIARNIIQSVELLTNASKALAEQCVDLLVANEERCHSLAELTLATATALKPVIGYDAATTIVKDAASSGRSLREVALEHGVDETILQQTLDLRKIAAGNEQ